VKKKSVAVLIGGNSPEHDISLMSGQEVIKNLNPTKYKVIPITISRDGKRWQIGDKKNYLLDTPANTAIRSNTNNQYISINKHPQIFNSKKIDLIFIALHGPNGEDGKIQSFLDLIGIKYTGSNPLASALAMDKIYSRKLFTQAGLTCPKYELLYKGMPTVSLFQRHKLPLFVKPYNQGSSIGVSKVLKKTHLKNSLKLAFEHSDPIIIEESIQGVEITVGVLGNNNPKALPPVEIVPKSSFFDYESKYNESKCDEICPARIPKSDIKKSQDIAIKAYNSLGCSGFGRVDMIISGNKIYVLEVNTIPGLTPVSLLPKAAKASGISYPQLLDNIIDFASP